MWLGIGIGTTFIIKKEYKKYNFETFSIRNIVLIGSLTYIIVYFSSGIFLGFTKSPFNHSFIGIIKNFWAIVSVAIGQEFLRNAFVKSTTNKNKWFILVVVTIFLAIVNVDINSFNTLFISKHYFVSFILDDFALLLISSSFLTYLAYKDGTRSTLYYRLPILIATLISPVFPKDAMALSTIIQMLIPLYIYMKIEEAEDYRNVFSHKEKVKLSEKIINGFYMLFILFIAIFSLGLLPYYPIVVLSDSMYPDIKRGDIVICEKTVFEKVDVSDIIVYSLNDNSIIHRVIEINHRADGIYLKTQGDNNNTPDPKAVTTSQIKAKVIFTIPKLGYPTIIIRDTLFGENTDIGVERGNK